MALTSEWRRRIENWRRELRNHLYRPLAEINLEGFATAEDLAPAAAAARRFEPMPPGSKWGAKWEVGWFRSSLETPAGAAGLRLAVRLSTGGESLLRVGGRIAGAFDREHTEVTLEKSAVPGKKYVLLAEAYAGHGPVAWTPGPVPPGRKPVPDCPALQREVGQSSAGVWEEDAYQLLMDVETLWSLRSRLDPDSLRASEVDRGLREFSAIVDFELPRERMFETFRSARKALAPLLACRNGSTSPTLFAFGHAHIDVAWLWPLAETRRKCLRTFANQLALLEEYPEAVFLQSQPELYVMTKERDADLYGRVAGAARGGRIAADGAMWVEADANITGGESLIRQIMRGRRFFREEFGASSEVCWLPDAFGFSAGLPQILRGCGVKGFATAKILWNYHGGDPFPYNTFEWEGADGSAVLAHMCKDYDSPADPATAIDRWKERAQKDGMTGRMFPFGFGDGGGGPTRDHLEFVRRLRDLEGAPKVVPAAPAEFFRSVGESGCALPRYSGELYFQGHRGTFTSQAEMKKLNRACENLLREAEMWGSAAAALRGFAFGPGTLDRAWHAVLVNQFHDILPGSSIGEVYAEAEASALEASALAGRTAARAAEALAGPGEGIAVFNPLSWERRALVPIPAGWDSAAGIDGRPLPVQSDGGGKTAEVEVPSCGWTSIVPSGAPCPAVGGAASASGRVIENGLIRAEFDDSGEIVSLTDSETGREFAAGPCNRLMLFKDVPAMWDAWDVDSIHEQLPADSPRCASIEVLSRGPLRASIGIERMIGESRVSQTASLARGSRRIEFATRVEWRERHRLLKSSFPVNIRADEAVHEAQFCHVRRPTHRSRAYDADRFEVPQQRWTALAEEGRGFAVLNDCKYGVSVLGGDLRLTLLKSALAPDPEADRGTHEFTYAAFPWTGSMAGSGVVREAAELNSPVRAVRGGSGAASLFSVSAPNVVVETVKPAEDGSGDVIVRLYESMRTATACVLATALETALARQTDMLEQGGRALEREPGGIPLDFRAFEIKTVRLSLRRKV